VVLAGDRLLLRLLWRWRLHEVLLAVAVREAVGDAGSAAKEAAS